MKASAITSLVLACALTVAVHAAPLANSTSEQPTPTFTAAPPPPSSTFAFPPSLPRGRSPRNGTLPDDQPPPFTVTDDAALLASLVDYDFEAAEKAVAHYYDAVYGDKPPSRSNAVSRAAVSTDILPFCVGIASNPVRVQIFKNKMTCTENGWTTLFIYTAHTKKDAHHAPYPICAGFGSGPSRSILFPNRSSKCSEGEFSNDFSFFESGMKIKYDASVNPLHESSVVWQAYNPTRMMTYPYYDGKKAGWESVHNLQYRSRYRLAPPYERAYLTTKQGNHESVHKKLSISSPPNAATSRCTLNLIQTWTTDFVNSGNPISIQGSDSARYKVEAERDECSNLVASSSIRLARVTILGVSSVEMVIGGKVYAAISINSDTHMPAVHVRTAFQESLRTGKPVMVADQRDKKLPDSVVAFIQDTFVTIGSNQVYGFSI
ncbi:hypothetical protein BGZ95_002681 [Linnemannia exigua]|uniref:Uncharacterized protein n=1 Tax=Linnemannia exigua TaxID=604196 RepID=A0AAD4DIF6_9FUNG|nr:hypothetical protein BGZ95_002681 [Linnemannia exigua]